MQYDVCPITAEDEPANLAVILQDDALSDLATRLIAPLIPAGAHGAADGIAPPVQIGNDRYVVAMYLMAPVPRRELGPPIASLLNHEHDLKRAIDLIFFGI